VGGNREGGGKERGGRSEFRVSREEDEGRGRGEGGEREREGIVGGVNRKRYAFWNVAGIGNKDKEFWRYVKEFDFISMCETWLEETAWEKMKEKLPETHEWICSFAKKERKRGRARGGFLIGYRKEGAVQGNKLKIIKEEEEMVMSEVGKEGERVRIISVYGMQGGKSVREKLEKFIGEEEEGNLIIGGDFNIRIGELGGERHRGRGNRKM
jgi:exonuclease III